MKSIKAKRYYVKPSVNEKLKQKQALKFKKKTRIS
jgi:ribosomal protein S21